MTGRRAALIIIITPPFGSLAPNPSATTHGVVRTHRLRRQKIEAHVVRAAVQQFHGRGQNTSQQQVALFHLKGRIHVHEPAADVPHEREAAAM